MIFLLYLCLVREFEWFWNDLVCAGYGKLYGFGMISFDARLFDRWHVFEHGIHKFMCLHRGYGCLLFLGCGLVNLSSDSGFSVVF